ncbi:MAG: BrnA antitoxin family protein [Bryobacteraceae bacterium]
MKAEYDFSKGKRGAVIPQTGKTRISIFIDNSILAEFRARAEKAGSGYQTMMNEVLRAYLAKTEVPITEEVLRHVLRQEMPGYLRDLTTRSSGPGKTVGRGGAPKK